MNNSYNTTKVLSDSSVLGRWLAEVREVCAQMPGNDTVIWCNEIGYRDESYVGYC